MTEPTLHEFKPDWCLAPSAPLNEWLEQNQFSRGAFALACGGRNREIEGAALVEDVKARRPLTEAHAATLERGTGIPARMWLALEHNYRAGLAAGLTDVSAEYDQARRPAEGSRA